MFEDTQGVLWAGSEYGGLIRYQNGAFQTVRLNEKETNGEVQKIQQNSAGDIVVLTKKGIFNLRDDGSIISFAAYDSPNVPTVFFGKSVVRWTLMAADNRRV